ncbi:MAG: MmcQ/YjbR family DNA-binding protein [Phycisphaerales bacterium]
MALALPEADEQDHWGRPSFRVRGRIFSTLWADDGKAMVKLTPEQQDDHVETHAGVFEPVAGTWGAQGATFIRLRGRGAAGASLVAAALRLAWENAAPRSLVRETSGAAEGEKPREVRRRGVR